MLQNERTFSSSTTFGICIFFANRKAIFLAFTSTSQRELTKWTQQKNIQNKKSSSSTNSNNNTCRENAGKQVERCCTMPFWCDAVYRLQAVNFQIDVCRTPNCCLSLYIFLPSKKMQIKTKNKCDADDVRDTVAVLCFFSSSATRTSWIFLDFFFIFALFSDPMLIFIRKFFLLLLFFIGHFRIVCDSRWPFGFFVFIFFLQNQSEISPWRGKQ